MAPPSSSKAAKGAARRGGGNSSSSNNSQGLGLLQKIYINAAVLMVMLGLWGAYRQLSGPRLPPQITPLNAPLMKQLPEFDAAYKDSMLWGSYRAGHYFGMRTRTSRPLLLGLMWFDSSPAKLRALQSAEQIGLRHEAEQGDKLTSYGWLRHDGRSYGRQELVDGDFNITVQMVKRTSEGSGPGGDWAVRISTQLSTAGRQRQEAEKAAAAEADGSSSSSSSSKPPQRRLSLLLYFADAHWHTGEVEVWPEGQQSKLGQGTTLLSGDNEDVGPWALHLLPGTTATTTSSTDSSSTPSKAALGAKLHHLGMRLQDGQQLVQLKQLVLQALLQTAQRLGFQNGVKLRLPNISQPQPNLAVFQVSAAAPAEFDLVFLTQSSSSTAAARLQALHGGALSQLAAEREDAFDTRFAETFPITATDSDSSNGDSNSDQQLLEVSKAALSNTLGSMGYFVGASRVKLPPGVTPPTPQPGSRLASGMDPRVVEYWREALFTAVPSRSFFPRGFLWDEGFHQLLVQRWDAQLSRDVIAHWLDLMNQQGWIPREQILGKEARARVPGEFLVQHPSHANPPSLYLPLLAHAAIAQAAPHEAVDVEEAARAAEFLKRAWPRLEAWYSWFNTSQAGTLPGSYMWKGRDASTQRELNPKTLMSGLDDYPRASHPTGDERHVDLLAWMVLASQAMAAVGTAAGAPAKSVQAYASAAAALGSMQRLQQLHYDKDSGAFADYGLHSEDVQLVWRALPVPEGAPPQREMVRQVGSPPTLQYVPSFGYVSLFPLLMTLIPPDSAILGQQLQLLQQEQLLWTPQGLRSLATTSSIYNKHNTEHDAPYWRGPIWININYLTLRALKHYSSIAGPHQPAAGDVYQRLRSNLLGNLVRQYSSTGYLWEQYDDGTGKPKGCHPFTGWTALLTLIAAEVY